MDKLHRITHIFCDIDGTLLNSRHEVTRRTRAVLGRLKETGREVVLVSARPPRAMLDIRRDAGASDTMICSAGAVTVRGMDILSSVQLPAGELKAASDVIRGAGVSLNIYRDWDWYVERNDRWPQYESRIVGFPPTVIPAGELYARWAQEGKGPNKMLLIGENERILPLMPLLKQAAGACAVLSFSKPTYLELLPPGIDKGAGVARYCAARGIPLAHTLACGDQDVDIPMMRAAGHSIAMANGSQNARAAAGYVALSNDEDGLAAMLEALLL